MARPKIQEMHLLFGHQYLLTSELSYTYGKHSILENYISDNVYIIYTTYTMYNMYTHKVFLKVVFFLKLANNVVC